jgi:DNA invertase Pin-like site-specific DNA recombinase
MAQMERELTAERTRAGLETTGKLGRKGCGRRRMTDSKIQSAKRLLGKASPQIRSHLKTIGEFAAMKMSG